MPLLILLFLVVPIAELYVIIQVGQAIGVLPTLAILLARLAGRLVAAALSRAGWPGGASRRRSAPAGRRRGEVIDGGLILLGGAFLLTPGLPHRPARPGAAAAAVARARAPGARAPARGAA